MGIPDNPEEIHGRDSVFSNRWSGSNHTSRDKFVQCPGFKIPPAKNTELIVRQLDLLEEHQELVTIRLVEYQ